MPEPTTDRFKLGRRTVLMAGILMALLALGWRFTRQKIDPRFVGKWSFRKSSSDYSPSGPTIDFRADGTALWQSRPQSSPAPLRWSMSRNRLVWRIEANDSLKDALLLAFDRLKARLWNPNGIASQERAWELTELGNGEFSVDVITDSQTIRTYAILRRIGPPSLGTGESSPN